MTIRNIQSERLALLLTFKAIYETRSISAAADSLGMTQSAASKHLQKLRDWMSDALFVRTSSGMEPTFKADHIIDRVEHIIQEMRALDAETEFDPSKLDGKFVISTTSEICKRLTVPLLEHIEKEAPNLNLSFIGLEPDFAARKMEMGQVNLVISVNWHAPDQLKQRRIFSDRFVCLLGSKHPLAKKKLTLKNYAEASHFLVAPMGKTKGYIDEQLERQGLKRNVKLSVPDFNDIQPGLLADKYLITLPHRIAKSIQGKSDMVIKNLPFDTPMIDYYIFWHQRFQNESMNMWMRELVLKILKV